MRREHQRVREYGNDVGKRCHTNSKKWNQQGWPLLSQLPLPVLEKVRYCKRRVCSLIGQSFDRELSAPEMIDLFVNGLVACVIEIHSFSTR
jgi:hypothetical protein